MNAAGRASQYAATRGMPRDRGRGIRFGQLGVRVQGGRVFAAGRDRGPVSGAYAGMVCPNPGYAFRSAVTFVRFADGGKPWERTPRRCDVPQAQQEVGWFNILADQAAAEPAPSAPYAGRGRAADPVQPTAGPQARTAKTAARVPVKTASAGSRAGTIAVTLMVFLVAATVISAGVDGIILLVQHTVTYPSRCAPSAYGPPAGICSASSQVQSVVWADALIYGIAVILWLIGLAAVIKRGVNKDA
jgi:hypothetical protein